MMSVNVCPWYVSSVCLLILYRMCGVMFEFFLCTTKFLRLNFRLRAIMFQFTNKKLKYFDNFIFI